MVYLIPVASFAITCIVQCILSILLIRLGYFSSMLYFYGFVLFAGLSYSIANYLLHKNKSKVNTKDSRVEDTTLRNRIIPITMILTILSTFGLHIQMVSFHESYEYEVFGVKTKAVITSKSNYKARIIYLGLRIQEKGVKRDINLIYASKELDKKNIGDSVWIIYSQRNPNMSKLLNDMEALPTQK